MHTCYDISINETNWTNKWLVRKAQYYPISIANLIISASRFQNELLVYKAALCFDLVKVRPKPNCCTIHELQVLKFFSSNNAMDFYKRKSTKREDTKKEDRSQNRLRFKQMSVNDINICSSRSSDKVNPKVEEKKGGATGPISASMH